MTTETRQTDHRNIDLTKLNLDIAFRRGGGKIIWQPRIICWIYDRYFRGEGLPAPYTGMTEPELYRSLGCSNRVYEFNQCVVSHEDPDVRFSKRDINDTDYEVLTETPVGNQRAIYRKSANTNWRMPVKWPISDEAEMKVATWRESRRTWTWDQEAYNRLSVEWQGLGAPSVFVPHVNVQKLYIWDMGVEGAVYALMDYPDTCEAYFEALAENQTRHVELISESPIEIINFGDNIHSDTLSVPLFERYVLPEYQRRCELLHKAGKFVHAHWDGNCRPLLPYAQETGLDGIEAITPLPQGDVTLEETKAGLGDMFLLDGIPAVFFDETFSEQNLIEFTKKVIDLFAPNLILGISDEMSSNGDIERIRLVGEIVDDYNASL